MTLSCFVLMPFSDPFNDYYQDVLVPAIKDADYEPLRADEIYGTRPVIEDIFNGIRNASVLIADVTGKNPNVNYELGIAHALRRPVIIISQQIDDIPFDYRHLRVIIYDIHQIDWESNLRNKIVHTLKQIKNIRLLPSNVCSLTGEVNTFMLSQSIHKVFYQLPFKRIPHITINCERNQDAAIIRIAEQEPDGFIVEALTSGFVKMGWVAEGELAD